MSLFGKKINLILRAIQNGADSKKKDLYEMTYNHLKGIAYIYAKNKNDSEDILTEAYLRIFKYIKSFDSSKDGYNWLCKIVQNTAYSFNKKYNIETPLEFTENKPSNAITEADITEKSSLQSEINKLSESDQQLLYMKFWEDRTYREIAAIIGSKKSTVHKRISFLIDEIKKNLKD